MIFLHSGSVSHTPYIDPSHNLIQTLDQDQNPLFKFLDLSYLISIIREKMSTNLNVKGQCLFAILSLLLDATMLLILDGNVA